MKLTLPKEFLLVSSSGYVTQEGILSSMEVGGNERVPAPTLRSKLEPCRINIWALLRRALLRLWRRQARR